jgi:hypothetical protein
MKNIYFGLLLAFSFLFSACDKPEDVPSYLYIKPFELTTVNGEGENTSKVTDAWVYVNNVKIGAYKVPGEVPIPATGNVDLIVYPGIKNNGSSATPAIYDHYTPYKVSLNMTATKTDTIRPKVTYIPNLKFAWMDNFEQQTALIFNVDKDSINNFQVTKLGAKFGANCGYFKVTEKSPTMSVTTKEGIKDLPSNQRVYLELDYKGTANLRVALAGNQKNGSQELEFVTYKAKGEWNKAYINFRFKDYSAVDYPSFNFIFAAELPTDDSGKPLVNEAELRIDNIKLIYPK